MLNIVKKTFIVVFVRVLRLIRLLGKGLAFFVLRIFAPIAGRVDKFLFYFALFPLYRLLRGIFHSAEVVSLPARRKILFLLGSRQAVPFFLLATSMLVAASSIYAKTESQEAEPGRRSILFSFLDGEQEELISESGLQNGQGAPAGEGAVASGAGLGSDYYVPEEEDEVLALILGGGAIVQPVISSASPSAAPRTKIETYAVKAGDTPGGIASRFGLKLTTLYWANNLSAYSYIKPGQELKIPPVDGVVYSVKRGDTIAKLAQTYRADTEKITAYNRLEANEKLSPGAVIIIPNGKPPPPPPPNRPAPVKNLIVPAASNALATGKMLWPILGTSSNNGRYITQYFRLRHPGVDIDGDYSNPILASDGGVVKLVRYGRTGYGYQVVVDHEDGMQTRYAHLSKIFVTDGQRVEKGQQLGITGTTGRSTGTHLHFEIFVNGRRVNPLGYIR
ncbi:M23 family metallopeptidase [Candidatus Uhrbacteria bacterium]|nr:M23 family metallopeptidase [Candidatus Uhrbacteria bacterium]